MEKYEQLQRILDSHPSGAPESKAFDKILKLLFTPDETDIAIHMNFSPKPTDELARLAGLTLEEAMQKLEAMADKVIIFSHEKDGAKFYGLVPTIPGLFEFPFMQGGGTPMHEKLGKLWEQYHADALGEAFAGNPTPLMRVVPVESTIKGQTTVHTYEEASKLVEQQDYLAVTKCACRVSVGACDKPREVCLVFGTPARFLVSRDRARKISRQEALEILRLSEEAGLVHTTNNSVDKANLICNCCPCCCTVLRGKTQLNHPHAFVTSSYIAVIQTDDCTGCGICADERCPMQAIEIENDSAAVIQGKCIGCGLCVSACPTQAIKLVARDEKPDIPATTKEMALKILGEKGKLEKFMEVMQR